MSEILIYQADNHPVEVRLEGETVWLSQRQLAELLDTTTDNISLHLKNIYSDGELDEAATTEESSVVQQEGKRRVTRQLRLYNLDAIISVAYRVNSKRGVQFRQWATRILREHLSRGYTLNQQRFESNARELEAALQMVRRLSSNPHLTAEAGRGLADIVSRYAQTFLLLQRYDEGLLSEPEVQAGGLLPTAEQARTALAELKGNLLARGEATDLFARERGDGLAALLGNLDQSAFG